MKTINLFKQYSIYALLSAGLLLTSCDDDDVAPDEENDLETITDVKLIFTNEADDTDVVEARAEDPDGLGIMELQIINEITLDAGKTYTLTFDIENALAEEDEDAHDDEEEEHDDEAARTFDEDEHGHGADITEEIEGEDDEHQFFFSFTEGVFSDPTGNGNIDNASDPINYNDEDSDAQDGSGNPVGLSTSWTAASSASTEGTFTVRLQHQDGGVKTSTSGAEDGDTDFELSFVINIQ